MELRPTSTLENIVNRHPNWSRMKDILDNGYNWTLENLEEGDRRTDTEEAISFGNQKGAKRNPVILRSLVEKGVTHGYGLVFPLRKVIRIPGIILAPTNIMTQNTIDEHGRIIDKDRLTHDQSYKWGSGTSVNSRVDKDELPPCRFGACLKRLMNWSVAAMRMYPGRRIVSSKIDLQIRL